MGDPSKNLIALLGSRICHDLISPIGAINNGLELLSMTASGTAGPEMALIQESCRSASARIRFFRVAFGVPSAAQRMGPAELRGILADYTQGSRMKINWMPEGETSRHEAQAAFLGLLCLETAMPVGGTAQVARSGDRWKLTAEAETLKYRAELWDDLPDGPLDLAHAPNLVHFCLLRDTAAALGRKPEVKQGHGVLTLTI